MKWIYNLFEFAAAFTEIFLAYRFLDLFSVTKKVKLKVKIVSCVALTTMVLALNAIELFSIWTTFLIISALVLTSVVLMNAKISDSLSVVSFFIFCVYCLDFLVISVMGYLLGRSWFAEFIAESVSLNRTIFLAVSKSMLIAFYLLVKMTMVIDRIRIKMLSLLSLLGFFGILFLIEATLQKIDFHIALNWSLLTVLMILIYLLFIFYTKYIKEKDKSIMTQIKSNMLQEQFLYMERRQKNQDRFYHDVKNHLIVLTETMKTGNYEEALAYAIKLEKPLRQRQFEKWTGNETIDLILNYKSVIAEEFQIKCIIDADTMCCEKISSYDICIILSNLLDNAVEACILIKENRWLHIHIRRINNMMMIRVENSIGVKPTVRNNELVTTKTNGNQHGLGIPSVKASIEKYGGEFKYGYDDTHYWVDVTFFSIN